MARWRSSEIRCGQLEEENRRLKQLVADLTFDKVILQEVPANRLKPARAQTRSGARGARAASHRGATSVGWSR